MYNMEILHKNKSLSLFHINAFSLDKYFDNLQYLLSSTEEIFDVIAISETRITKKVSLSNNLNLNKYSLEFTPAETSADGIFIYIANHLSYKCCNDLNIYKNKELNLLLLKLSVRKNQVLLWKSFTDIYLQTLLTLIAVT